MTMLEIIVMCGRMKGKKTEIRMEVGVGKARISEERIV